jgi:hypothetical protein
MTKIYILVGSIPHGEIGYEANFMVISAFEREIDANNERDRLTALKAAKPLKSAVSAQDWETLRWNEVFSVSPVPFIGPKPKPTSTASIRRDTFKLQDLSKQFPKPIYENF